MTSKRENSVDFTKFLHLKSEREPQDEVQFLAPIWQCGDQFTKFLAIKAAVWTSLAKGI